MKNSTIRNIAFCAMSIVTFTASGVQIVAEDVSNKVLTCNSPLLVGKPAGSCIVEPPNTLIVTAKLDAGEDASILNKMYVATSVNGKYIQYVNDPNLSVASRWVERPNIAALQPSTATFEKAPFEMMIVSRQVRFDQLSGIKGAEIYVGVNESDDHPFTEKNFKKVFSIK